MRMTSYRQKCLGQDNRLDGWINTTGKHESAGTTLSVTQRWWTSFVLVAAVTGAA